ALRTSLSAHKFGNGEVRSGRRPRLSPPAITRSSASRGYSAMGDNTLEPTRFETGCRSQESQLVSIDGRTKMQGDSLLATTSSGTVTRRNGVKYSRARRRSLAI